MERDFAEIYDQNSKSRSKNKGIQLVRIEKKGPQGYPAEEHKQHRSMRNIVSSFVFGPDYISQAENQLNHTIVTVHVSDWNTALKLHGISSTDSGY